MKSITKKKYLKRAEKYRAKVAKLEEKEHKKEIKKAINQMARIILTTTEDHFSWPNNSSFCAISHEDYIKYLSLKFPFLEFKISPGYNCRWYELSWKMKEEKND